MGCGEGGNLVPFAQLGCRVTGIDIAECRIIGGIGFIYNFAAIGGGVSPVIAAALSERVGLGSALVYVTLFWTIVLVALVGLRLPERIQARMQQ